MFLGTFDDTQRDAFLALAASLAPAGEKGLVQWPLWREWLTEMDLPPLTVVGWDDIDLAATAFTTVRDRLIVMLELARIGWEATNHCRFLPNLERIGRRLGCSPEELAAVLRWAERLAAAKADAVALLLACDLA